MMPDLISSSIRRGILGLGQTGLSVARFWRDQGLPFIAMDTRAELQSDLGLRRELSGVETHFGELDEGLMDQLDLLIASPGIAMDSEVIKRAQSQGVDVRGDIDLFVAEATVPVIGITGSNGKSTVTTYVGQLLTSCGLKVAVGGNIGVPALDLLDCDVDVYVLELSSFQLERAGNLDLAVAAVLNLSPDHLDRHRTMPLYHLAKHRIFAGAQHVVANYRDSLTQPIGKGDVPWTVWRDNEPDIDQIGLRDSDGVTWICHGFEPLCPVSAIPVVGKHNVENALAALSIGRAMGLEFGPLIDGLTALEGLPHRCELIAIERGISFVNDSKGTNVAASVAALAGLADGQNIVLIAGGDGKGQSFEALAKAAVIYAKHVVLIGLAADEIEGAIGGTVPVSRVCSMKEAVDAAISVASAGDTVLLSPGCASFDMFRDYVDRGETFKAAVVEAEASL